MYRLKNILWLVLISHFLGSVNIIQGQTTKKETGAKNEPIFFMKIADYKIILRKELTKQDSINWKIKGKDTLVMVKGDLKKIIASSGMMKRKIPENKMIGIRQSRSFMKIGAYKRIYNKPLTRQDTLNFQFNGNDTLVMISGDLRKNFKSVPYEVKDSAFLEIYKDVVYKKRNGKQADKFKKLTMRLWKDELNIYFKKSIGTELKKELMVFTTMLSKNVDSLKINYVDQVEKSNYIIYGIDSINTHRYISESEKKKGSYYFEWDRRQRINSCIVELRPNGFANKKDFIIDAKRKIFVTLGHFNYTSALPTDSFLHYSSVSKKFSKTDLEILQYHYSYGISKGVTLKTFEKNHAQAQKLLREENRLMKYMH